MKQDWELKKIGDLCTLMTGGTPSKSKKEYFEGGKIRWLVSGDIHRQEIKDCDGRITDFGMENSSTKFLPLNSVMIALNGQGKTRGTVALLRTKATCNQSLVSIYPNDEARLLPEFLYMNLHGRYEEIRKITGDSGNERRGLNMPIIRNIRIPVPPVEEQKKIMNFLSDALKKIEQAKNHAEINLINARELFETSVDAIFSQKGKGWSEKKLGDIAYLAGRIGWKGLTAKEYTKKGPFFLSVHSLNYGDYVDFRDAFHISQERYDESPEIMLQPDDVLICKDGAGIGKMGMIKELPGPATINSSMLLIRALAGVKPKYLYRALCSQSFQRIIKEKIDGATTPHLYQRDIRQFLVPMPPLAEQNNIIKRLDAIHAETLRLEAIYKQKLKELAELKQSLLEKAFSGKLTANNVVAFARPASSQRAVETTSPEFAAHVLAFGHHWHEAQRRNNTYGHVKGQKFLHMAESEGKADMGRQPIKDAAGPNDFQHMLRAEEWAKSQQFFEFVPRRAGNGYDFKKLANYNTIISDSIAAIKPYKDKLEKILGLMMPMNSQEAEVLATVHAAWNNLLLDNATITDDLIVREARNNWHPSKMNIPEAKFRKAITTIRNNGIVPDGTAKRVRGQENLF